MRTKSALSKTGHSLSKAEILAWGFSSPLAMTTQADNPHLGIQDHGKGGLSLRLVAVMTETTITAETAKTVKTTTVASFSPEKWTSLSLVFYCTQFADR